MPHTPPGEGTDGGQVWFLVMTGVVAVPAVLLLVTRLAPARLVTRLAPARHRLA